MLSIKLVYAKLNMEKHFCVSGKLFICHRANSSEHSWQTLVWWTSCIIAERKQGGVSSTYQRVANDAITLLLSRERSQRSSIFTHYLSHSIVINIFLKLDAATLTKNLCMMYLKSVLSWFLKESTNSASQRDSQGVPQQVMMYNCISDPGNKHMLHMFL